MSESTPVPRRTTRTLHHRASRTTRNPLYNPLSARISQQMLETSGAHRLTEAITQVTGLKTAANLRSTGLLTTGTSSLHNVLRPWLEVQTRDWTVIVLGHLHELLQPTYSVMEELFSDWMRSLRYWGRRCYLAACAAGEAMRRGDLEPITAFIEDELKLRPTEDRVQALATALLSDDWDLDLDIDDDARVKGFLRSQAREGTTLLGDHIVRGRPIAYMPDARGLELRPAPVPGPDQQVLSRLEPWDDRRLYLVMERLTGPEREVARTWSQDDRTSWSQAAILCGQSPEFGERVRRKLKREGSVITRRAMERSSLAADQGSIP